MDLCPKGADDVQLGIRINLETAYTEISPVDEVSNLLKKSIPEIQSGEIEIIKIARRVGRLVKIAIMSKKYPNLYKKCIGSGGKILKKISSDLDNERVDFIFWNSRNFEDCVCESLRPLRKQDILNVQIDSEKKKAYVKVKNGDPVAHAIGKDGDNVRLASEICDIDIEILFDKTPSK